MNKPTIEIDAEKQLLLLRDLTARTGVLHDAQVYQLKWWPLVLFTHATKCEERVNIQDKEIDFVLVSTKGRAPSDMKQRFDAINEWTKWLLGNDWLVRVKLRDKLLFRGPRTVALKTKPEEEKKDPSLGKNKGGK